MATRNHCGVLSTVFWKYSWQGAGGLLYCWAQGRKWPLSTEHFKVMCSSNVKAPQVYIYVEKVGGHFLRPLLFRQPASIDLPPVTCAASPPKDLHLLPQNTIELSCYHRVTTHTQLIWCRGNDLPQSDSIIVPFP